MIRIGPLVFIFVSALFFLPANLYAGPGITLPHENNPGHLIVSGGQIESAGAAADKPAAGDSESGKTDGPDESAKPGETDDDKKIGDVSEKEKIEEPPAAKSHRQRVTGPRKGRGREGKKAVDSDQHVPPLVREAISSNEFMRRISRVSRLQRFSGAPPGGGRWQRDAIGAGNAQPVMIGFTRNVLRTMALHDGSAVWLASGIVDEPSAVLRLGDLLPLLSVLGINDREAALSVSEIAFGGGAHPPAYTMTFKTGVLWPYRNILEAAERNGRILYCLVTGRLTVLGALVVADAEGNLNVRLVTPEGDDVSRYRTLLMPGECKPLEDALRSANHRSAVNTAVTLLDRASVVQSCAARYLAVAAPEDAVNHLRRIMLTGQVGQPGDVTAALVHLNPVLSDENVEALVSMIERSGVSGALGVCRNAPLMWSDILLDRDDISEPNKRTLRRCLRN